MQEFADAFLVMTPHPVLTKSRRHTKGIQFSP